MGQQREDHQRPEALLHLLMRTVREQSRARSLAGVLAACALLSTGCSPGGEHEHVVFKVATGFSNKATARTTDLVDIGLPSGNDPVSIAERRHGPARGLAVVPGALADFLQARPLLPATGEDRLHRRRARRLAVSEPLPDDDHHLA